MAPAGQRTSSHSITTGVREQLVKIDGVNKMRVFQQVWEQAPKGKWNEEHQERTRLRKELMEKFGTR